MPKPRKKRVVRFDPKVVYFKPRGVPLSELEEVVLVVEELEALRLADFEDLDQVEAAKKMKISQSTFNRVLTAANKKVAEALVLGKAIKVKGGDYIMPRGFWKRFRSRSRTNGRTTCRRTGGNLRLHQPRL